VDWAEDHHDIAVVDEQGVVLFRANDEPATLAGTSGVQAA
jgi:hypothetical protein